MAQNPDYNVIPVEIIILEVLNLENLKLGMLHNIITQSDVNYFVTVLRIDENYSNYLALVSREITPLYPEPLIYFVTAQYGTEGTLVANSFNINAIEVPLTNVRSRMDVNFRSQYYGLCFNVPQIDRYREIKQAISNLFVFPNLTYVLFGELVVSFTYVKGYFTFSYLGKLCTQRMMVDPYVRWDYAEGTLLGLFNDQLIYLWNKNYFAMSNSFPELSFDNSFDMQVILGGTTDYMISNQVPFVIPPSNNLIVRATVASRFNYNIPQLTGDLVDFITLRTFVLIANTTLYIIAFSNVVGTSAFPSYALLLDSNPVNANYPFTTREVIVTLTPTKTVDFQTVGGISFYLKDGNELLVYEVGFPDYLASDEGHIILSDLNPYYLYDHGPDFDPVNNNFVCDAQQQQFQGADDGSAKFNTPLITRKYCKTGGDSEYLPPKRQQQQQQQQYQFKRQQQQQQQFQFQGSTLPGPATKKQGSNPPLHVNKQGSYNRQGSAV